MLYVQAGFCGIQENEARHLFRIAVEEKMRRARGKKVRKICGIASVFGLVIVAIPATTYLKQSSKQNGGLTWDQPPTYRQQLVCSSLLLTAIASVCTSVVALSPAAAHVKAAPQDGLPISSKMPVAIAEHHSDNQTIANGVTATVSLIWPEKSK